MNTRQLFKLFVAFMLTGSWMASLSPAEENDYIFGVISTASSNANDPNYHIRHMTGVLRSRWIAGEGQSQWMQFELKEPLEISEVKIRWEDAYATDFDIQLAMTEGEWTEVYRATDLKKIPRDPIQIDPPQTAKFVRINFHKQALKYSYSIFEVKINGKTLYEDVEMVEDLSFRDASLSPEERTEIVLNQMTFLEKQAYTTGHKNFFITPLLRFGLRSVYMTDASGGLHIRSGHFNMERSIAYPSLISLAATWEPELAHRYASAIGSECRALGTDVLLGPGLNFYRNSMCGRSFEYMGEDPFLIGLLATEYVKGIQSKGVLATAKHFILNNHEWLRHYTDVQIDDRTIREFYSRPWYRLAQEADLGAIMGAYNLIHGHKTCENKDILVGLLREEIGFKGLVMSDWGAVRNGNKAASAGLDLTMGSGSYRIPEVEADRAELEAQLTEMTRRIMTTCFRFGFYDRDRKSPEYLEGYPEYEATALHTARRAVTLLRNEQGTLPLTGDKASNILITGRAKTPISGTGSGAVKGYNHQNVLDELKKIYGDEKIKLSERPTDEEMKNASAVVVRVRTKDGEHSDAPYQLDKQEDIDLLNRCVELQPNTVVVFFSGRGANMDNWGDKAGAILHAYYPGQAGAQAIAEVIAGNVNPSGKLPFTIEKSFADNPAADYRPEGAGLSDQRKTEVDKALPKTIKTHYKEGVFVGYRWYDQQKIDVRFPFGHGLSYTRFDYSKLKIKVRDTIDVSFKLDNTGDVEGAEVAQVYFTSPATAVERPVKELCGFRKVDLNAGKDQTVRISIDPEDLSYYDVERKRWIAPAGEYTIHVGSSSGDLRLNGSFTLKEEQTFIRPVPSK
jgi:beta-glucosidase